MHLGKKQPQPLSLWLALKTSSPVILHILYTGVLRPLQWTGFCFIPYGSLGVLCWAASLPPTLILPIFLHFIPFLLQALLTCFSFDTLEHLFFPTSVLHEPPKWTLLSFPEPLPYHVLPWSPDCSPCLCTVSNSAQWTWLGELGNLSMTWYWLICFLEKYILCCEKEKETL